MQFRFHAISATFAFAAATLAPQLAQAQTYQMEILQPLHAPDQISPSSLDEHDIVTGVNVVAGTGRGVVVNWKNGIPKMLDDPLKRSFIVARRSAHKGYVVAGSYEMGDSVLFGPDGSVTTLVTPASGHSWAEDVDDLGRVVGGQHMEDTYSAIQWTLPTQLPEALPTKEDTRLPTARRITKNGWVVGNRYNRDIQERPIVWKNGELKNLNALHGFESLSLATINMNGTAGGYGTKTVDGHYVQMAVLWKAGTLVMPNQGKNDEGCQVLTVNDNEVAAGACDGLGVIWKGEKIVQVSNHLSTELQAAGWFVESVYEMNNAGSMLATVNNRNFGLRQAALLRPIQD